MSPTKNNDTLLELEKEKTKLFVNILNFFFSAIPTLINLFNKYWVITGSEIQPAVYVPINALGVFTIGGQFTSTLEKVLKSVPKEKNSNAAENILNIVFLVIYGIYIVIVPVTFFINYENDLITAFSFWTLLIRAFQCLISMLVNIGNIRKYAKAL